MLWLSGAVCVLVGFFTPWFTWEYAGTSASRDLLKDLPGNVVLEFSHRGTPRRLDSGALQRIPKTFSGYELSNWLQSDEVAAAQDLWRWYRAESFPASRYGSLLWLAPAAALGFLFLIWQLPGSRFIHVMAALAQFILGVCGTWAALKVLGLEDPLIIVDRFGVWLTVGGLFLAGFGLACRVYADLVDTKSDASL